MITFILTTLILFLLLGAATLATSMQIGVLGISRYELKRRSEEGDEEAHLAYPLRSRSGELITILTLKKVACEVLFVVILMWWLPDLAWVTAIFTVLIATIALAVIVELLPRAWLKPYGFRLASRVAPYIVMGMDIIKPLSLPVVKRFSIDEPDGPEIHSVEELIDVLNNRRTQKETKLDAQQLAVVRGALNFGSMTIREIMTPRSVVVAVDQKTQLNTGQLKKLHDSGHSRFPVFEGTIDHMVGILYLHDLVDLKRDSITAGEAAVAKVYYVNEDENLEHVLNAFIKTRRHLFMVVNEFEEVVGLVTIEDVLEQILGRKIVDEFDKYHDLREVAAKRKPVGQSATKAP